MQKCDICGKEFEGVGNNPAPFNGRTCCDECNSQYVIPARLGMNNSKDKLSDADVVIKNPEKYNEREFLGRLMDSEVEAIHLYDDFLRQDISNETRSVIEKIRNDEIDHASKLGKLLKGTTTGAVEEDLLEESEVKDDLFKSASNVVGKAASSLTKGLSAAEDEAISKVDTPKMNSPEEIKGVGKFSDNSNDVEEHKEEMTKGLTESEKEALNIKDSDQPNDMGMVWVGMKVRIPDKYGNVTLTVMEVQDGNVTLSMDGGATSISVDLEEFEKGLRENKIDNVSAITNEEQLLKKFNDKLGKTEASLAVWKDLKSEYGSNKDVEAEDIRYTAQNTLNRLGYSDKVGVVLQDLIYQGKLISSQGMYTIKDSKKFRVKVGDRNFVVEASSSKEAADKVRGIFRRR